MNLKVENVKKILLVNMLRLGDIIMYMPIVELLKLKYPSAEIHILINKQFKKIIQNSPHIDKLFLFERSKLQDQIADSNESILAPFEELEVLISKLNSEDYSLVLNLTHNKLSTYLISLLDIRNKVGAHYNDFDQLEFNSRWLAYLNTHTAEKKGYTFHFNEVFSQAIEEKYYQSKKAGLSEVIKDREQILSVIKQEELNNFILIQPFTSDEKKNWGIENIIQYINLLRKLKIENEIIFLGAPFEEAAINEILDKLAEKNIKVFSFICSLSEALSAIHQAKLLITVDTSIKHLATSTDCPVIEISLGSSNKLQTGIYKADQIIVEPHIECFPCSHSSKCIMSERICAMQIEPSSLALITKHFIYRDFQSVQKIAREYNDQIKVYLTRYSNGFGWQAICLDDSAMAVTQKLTQIIEKTCWKEVNNYCKGDMSEIGSKAYQLYEQFDKFYIMKDQKTHGLMQKLGSHIEEIFSALERVKFRLHGLSNINIEFIYESEEELDKFKSDIDCHSPLFACFESFKNSYRQDSERVGQFNIKRKLQVELDQVYMLFLLQVKVIKEIKSFLEKGVYIEKTSYREAQKQIKPS